MGDGNVGVWDGGGIVVVSAGHVVGTRGSGIVSRTADVIWMSMVRGIRGVCEVFETPFNLAGLLRFLIIHSLEQSLFIMVACAPLSTTDLHFLTIILPK